MVSHSCERGWLVTGEAAAVTTAAGLGDGVCVSRGGWPGWVASVGHGWARLGGGLAVVVHVRRGLAWARYL